MCCQTADPTRTNIPSYTLAILSDSFHIATNISTEHRSVDVLFVAPQRSRDRKLFCMYFFRDYFNRCGYVKSKYWFCYKYFGLLDKLNSVFDLHQHKNWQLFGGDDKKRCQEAMKFKNTLKREL